MKSLSITSLAALLSASIVTVSAGNCSVNIGCKGDPPGTGVTPLRVEAAKKDLLFGCGSINPNFLEDQQFGVILAREFGSLSPENELKWSESQPTKDYYAWRPLDRLIEFAEKHGLAVKGHGLLTGENFFPDYLLNVTDPDEMRHEIEDHITTVMRRYKGKMDRQVISEALDAGITDISFWGLTDKYLYTWVPGAKPTMFDENYRPKGAYYATHDALSNFVIS
ncbi:glycoside hydrolase [Sarocladium strictum]